MRGEISKSLVFRNDNCSPNSNPYLIYNGCSELCPPPSSQDSSSDMLPAGCTDTEAQDKPILPFDNDKQWQVLDCTLISYL